MGASEAEYTRVAPHNSFIHVDQFRGPEQLAEHLHMLDRDKEKYNEYFKVILININSDCTALHYIQCVSRNRESGTGLL